MGMVVAYVLLAVSFAMLLAGAVVFTNAIEWAGQRLDLGHGAVGSILTAVATALPETVIPVIAIIGGGGHSASIAVGSILGAPFLLGTLAMLLVGGCAIGFRGRRRQREGLSLDRRAVMTDLGIFAVCLTIALVLGVVGFRALNIAAAIVFVIGYGVYAWHTIAGGKGKGSAAEELSSLYFDPTKHGAPGTALVLLQLAVGLGLIVFGAHLFVTQIENIATSLGISALLLALVLAPLASELPETVNSFLWMRQGKDALAMGNITGAMLFQAMVTVAVGLALTRWELTNPAVVVAGAAVVGGGLALVAVLRYRRFPVAMMVGWGVLYAGSVAYVIAVA